MSLYWYACISTNTYRFEMYHISLETDWWALSNASSIVRIHSAVHEILADKAFTATDGLISQSFVVALILPAYVQIALIWGFLAQLGLWKLVHWLWRYKLNEVCDRFYLFSLIFLYFILSFLFSFFILDLGKRSGVILHLTVTQVTKCDRDVTHVTRLSHRL